MDAGRARELREATDRRLHFGRRDEHEIGEFVDHDDDERELLIRVFEVIFFDFAHTGFGEALVARIHLARHFEQSARREFRIGDRGLDEMRDAVVDRKFDALGIDEEHLHFIRRRTHEERCDNAVEADALPTPRRACHEQMRHLTEIAENGAARNIFAQGHVERRDGSAIGQGLKDLADRDDRRDGIGHLDADRRFAGDRRFDAHRRRCEREGDIVGE